MQRSNTRDHDELERFKTDINLTEYAAHLGYAMDRRACSRNSVAMHRLADSDKVIIARDSDQHWIYFSVRDDRDNGSIIDFHQHRTGTNLGQTRQELRAFMGLEPAHRPAPKAYADKVEITPSRDQQALDNEYRHTENVTTHAYLNMDRAVGRGILSADRFADRSHCRRHR